MEFCHPFRNFVRDMKSLRLTLLLLLSVVFGQVQAGSERLPDSLSPGAQISLLTCAPGAELYSIFGHSSIRVNDPGHRIDWVFNYGTFDFDTPGFVLKFAQGKLEYYLLSYSMRNFMPEYEMDQRAVREQVLNLTQDEKNAILRALKENEKSENKFYKYDFFYDNCSSRERDILRQVLGKNVSFRAPKDVVYGSYRSLIAPYLSHIPWTEFGINLVLGMPADKEAGVDGAVFLPDHLHDIFGASKVMHNGREESLVKSDELILKTEPLGLEPGPVTPWIVMWLIAAIGAGISYLPFGKARIFYLFDTLLFGVVGLLGLLLLTFWTLTDHQATYGNLNLIWALPTHLFFAVGVWVPRWKGAVSRYAKYTGGLLILFFLVNWFLPQAFPGAIYPIVAIMAARLISFWQRVQE